MVVVCGPPRMADERQDVLLDPTLLIEVLSDSTQARDRGIKAEGFRRLASPQEYLFVAPREVRVARYRRFGERQWIVTEALATDAALELESVGCRLALADVYRKAFDHDVERVSLPEEDHG